MVAQLTDPITPALAWLLPPQMPPRHTLNAFGWRLQKDGTHILTTVGEVAGPVSQRVLAASMLRLLSREQIGEHYGLCVRQVQEIVTGNASGYLTASVRARLHKLGIGRPDVRAYKGNLLERVLEIRAAYDRLAVLSADALRDGDLYSQAQRDELAADLWLLSGAWLNDEETNDGN